MEHRFERAIAQLEREPLDVDAVILVAALVLAAHVTDDELLGVRHEQIVQPLRLGAFLERHVDTRPATLHQLQDRPGLSGHGGPHDDLSVGIATVGQDRCLMQVRPFLYLWNRQRPNGRTERLP